MAVIHMRNGQKVEAPVRRRYKQNGFDYGYIQFRGKAVEVCQDTTIHHSATHVEKQWSEVQHYEAPNDNNDEILTY